MQRVIEDAIAKMMKEPAWKSMPAGDRMEEQIRVIIRCMNEHYGNVWMEPDFKVKGFDITLSDDMGKICVDRALYYISPGVGCGHVLALLLGATEHGPGEGPFEDYKFQFA